MYSHVHGVVGAVTYTAAVTVGNAIGAPILGHAVGFFLGYVSHFLMDYLGEHGYGDNKISSLIEFPHLITFGTLGFLSGHFWLYFIGWVAGNLPDLIDKPLRLTGLVPQEWHSCHNGPGLFQWKGKKLGYPVRWRLTRDETIVAGILATMLLTMWTFAIKLEWILPEKESKVDYEVGYVTKGNPDNSYLDTTKIFCCGD